MPKRAKEAAGLIVRKTPRGIAPVSAFDQEQLMGDAVGTEYRLVKLTKRSLPQHRAYWQALTLAVQSTDRWATAEHLHSALKRACGRVSIVHDLTGRPFVTEDSAGFDAMTHDEFTAYFRDAMARLAEAVGFDPLAFLEQAA